MDENGDAVSDATVVALRVRYERGERVLLPPAAVANWFPGRVNSFAEGEEAVSDESGSYRLFDLPPGDYYIGVWRDLDRGALGNVVRAHYYPGVTDPSEAVPLTVRPGRDVAGIAVQLAAQPTYRFSFKIVDSAPSARVASSRTMAC